MPLRPAVVFYVSGHGFGHASRDIQIVNLQMNTMVAGTMLRGMFEDRIQNVIRELKERTNLVLFVDEASPRVLFVDRATGRPTSAPSPRIVPTPCRISSRGSTASRFRVTPRGLRPVS